MAKNLSAPEAVAVARLAVTGKSPELVELVESQLHEDPDASSALEVAKEHPRDVESLSRLAGYVRKYGRGKNFRTGVRSALGSRARVAAIGIAELVAAVEPGQRPEKLVDLVESRVADDTETRARLQAVEENPDSLEAVSEFADRLRPRFDKLRSLPYVPITDPPNGVSPKRLKGALPEFLRVFRGEAKGIALDPKGQRLVGDLLRNGSQAVKSAPEDDREQLRAKSEEDLRRGIRVAVQQLREQAHDDNGAVFVDAHTLAEVMRGNCPLPPFCVTPIAERAGEQPRPA